MLERAVDEVTAMHPRDLATMLELQQRKINSQHR